MSAATEASLLLPLRWRLCATLASAEQAAFKCDPYNSYEDDEEEADDIQAMVLYPVQVMGSCPKMCGSFVSHDELSPENSQVQRLHGTVQVHRGQPHYVLLVTGDKEEERQSRT